MIYKKRHCSYMHPIPHFTLHKLDPSTLKQKTTLPPQMRNFINHLFREGPQAPHQCPRVQLTSQLGTTRARIGVNFILESGINEVEDIWQ